MKTNSLSNAQVEERHPIAAPGRRSGGATLYLVLWLLLAAGALVYLGALAVAPNQLTALLGSPKPSMAEPNGDTAAEGPSTAVLEGEIDRLKGEIAQVRGEVRTLVDTNQGLTKRLETIEDASIQVQAGESSPVPISQGKAKASDNSEDGGISGVVIGEDVPGDEEIAASEPVVSKPEKKSQKKSDERLDEDKGDKVAEVEVPAVPAVEKKKKTFGLELAISTSPEALQLNWDLLNERHGDLLKGLSARAQPSPSDPTSYRLVTGPFTSAQQAQSLCAKLKKQNVTCQVTGFGGDNL